MTVTAGNLGLTKPNYGLNQEDGMIAGQSTHAANLDAIDAAITALQQGERDQVEVEAASGAIGIKEGLALITAGSAAALTLAAPTAGSRSAGGDDGKHLSIVSSTAFAHTITTPANKINGNKLTITFTAAVGNSIELIAYGGVWYQTNASVGGTLS